MGIAHASVKDFTARTSDSLLGRIARQFFGPRVETGDPEIPIDGNDAGGHTIHNELIEGKVRGCPFRS